MINGFKEFILRGNVIDLAVAVVIGAAFSTIVNVLVDSLINPLIGLFFEAGSLDKAMVVEVRTLGNGTSVFEFGAIIGAVIHFLIVAFVVYLVFVVPMNHAKARAEKLRRVAIVAPLPTETELLMDIRELLQTRRE